MINNPLVKVAFPPLVVLILHIVATMTGWYEAYWWFDIPMHFLGGVAITLSSCYLLQDFANRKQFVMQSAPLKILTLLAFTALAAVAWEFFEFSFDIIFHAKLQPGIVDTMKDLAMGLTGSGLIAIIASLKTKK